VSFNVNNNPFQGSYLFNYTLQTGTHKPTQTSSATQPQGNGLLEMQTFLDDQWRSRNENEQRKKKHSQSQPKTMQEMMQQLSTQKQEVSRLRNQLETTNDPALQQLLQDQFGSKSQHYSDLENQVSLMFRGPGGGFVGSEGKIDHVGGFATTS
jgi:hypothetical protein